MVTLENANDRVAMQVALHCRRFSQASWCIDRSRIGAGGIFLSRSAQTTSLKRAKSAAGVAFRKCEESWENLDRATDLSLPQRKVTRS